MASGMEERFAREGSEYLREKNFKTLAEWLTAEVVFARPADPLAHVAGLVAAKLAERAEGASYSAADADSFLAGVYSSPPDEGAAAPVLAAAAAGKSVLAGRVLEAGRAIAAELDPVKAAGAIVKHACDSLCAERATLWSVDDADASQLVAMVTEDDAVRAVRVPVGQGIAGIVADTGEPLSIADVYEDARFNQDVDRDTGFRTRAMLCYPVRDARDAIVGVLQVMNKRPAGDAPAGGFTPEDEELCSMLSLHVGVALRNVQTFESAVRARAKTEATLSLVRALHEHAPSASSVMFAVHSKAPRIVDADRCSFFLVDHAHAELFAIQGEVDVRVPLDRGIAGHVASTLETVNIPDAYADDRWGGQAMDRSSGFTTRAILCMPLLGADGRALGVLQCINKLPKSGRDAFDREDEDVLGTLLALVAPIIERSGLLRQRSSSEGEGSEFSGKKLSGDHASAAAASAQPAIAEEDEEEEDDEDA